MLLHRGTPFVLSCKYDGADQVIQVEAAELHRAETEELQSSLAPEKLCHQASWLDSAYVQTASTLATKLFDVPSIYSSIAVLEISRQRGNSPKALAKTANISPFWIAYVPAITNAATVHRKSHATRSRCLLA
jgi:hypothetical protein